MPFALIPLLLNLAPTVASWIMGDSTGKAVQQVTDVATKVLGTADPEAAQAAMADPNKALDFKLAVMQLEAQARKDAADAERADRQAQLDAIKTQLADVASARQQTVSLAQAKSGIAWGAPVVSVLSIVLAGAVAYMLLWPGADSPKWTETVITLVAGAAINWVNTVQGYWLGSSSGSGQTTDALTAMAHKALDITGLKS